MNGTGASGMSNGHHHSLGSALASMGNGDDHKSGAWAISAGSGHPRRAAEYFLDVGAPRLASTHRAHDMAYVPSQIAEIPVCRSDRADNLRWCTCTALAVSSGVFGICPGRARVTRTNRNCKRI